MNWNDENAGSDLGTRLKLLEAPEHRVDLNEVLRAGRRGERRRRFVTGAGVLALVAAVAVPVATAMTREPVKPSPSAEVDVGPVRKADCTIEELPRPAGTDYTLERVDPTGRI